LEPADDGLIAINAVIYRAARFPLGDAAINALEIWGFPSELLDLRLGTLLRVLLFVSFLGEQSRRRRKQRRFAATDFGLAIDVDRAAATILGDWPQALKAVLNRMLPADTGNPFALNFARTFGNFYRHLLRVVQRQESGFLHEAFESFVIENWKGLIRSQHRWLSATVRRNSRWLTATRPKR
jgi:hypothetical protein